MERKEFNLKKNNAISRELIADTLGQIPKILGIPIMDFCNIMGEKLNKSEQTIHDYMYRKYIPAYLTYDELAKAIDETIEHFIFSDENVDEEIMSQSERTCISEKWAEKKQAFLSIIKFGYCVQSMGKCLDYAEKNIIPAEMQARMQITQFLNIDLSLLNNSKIDVTLIKFLKQLQFALNCFPEIRNLTFSKEEADVYMAFIRAFTNFPKLTPIQFADEQ